MFYQWVQGGLVVQAGREVQQDLEALGVQWAPGDLYHLLQQEK